MRFHIGLTLRPKQILTIIGVIGGAIAALFAGGVLS